MPLQMNQSIIVNAAREKVFKMAKVVALVSAICITLAISTIAHGHDQVFNIEGDVYCDPCRVQFQTTLSQKLPGATVRLVCTDDVTGKVTYDVQGVTNADGHYSLQVVGDHENDMCEVTPVKSPLEDCNEPMTEVEKSRIVCTENSGMHTTVRFANPLGFMTKNIHAQCPGVLQELDLHDF
ncbi:anther-specific protein LAT52-like [Primulina eburnea]|uniref:anther-specific protein LAT52-like n=1 Tax=Primulina eburnea TaxID=1245227 RepID=UPI003C6CA418